MAFPPKVNNRLVNKTQGQRGYFRPSFPRHARPLVPNSDDATRDKTGSSPTRRPCPPAIPNARPGPALATGRSRVPPLSPLTEPKCTNRLWRVLEENGFRVHGRRGRSVRMGVDERRCGGGGLPGARLVRPLRPGQEARKAPAVRRLGLFVAAVAAGQRGEDERREVEASRETHLGGGRRPRPSDDRSRNAPWQTVFRSRLGGREATNAQIINFSLPDDRGIKARVYE